MYMIVRSDYFFFVCGDGWEGMYVFFVISVIYLKIVNNYMEYFVSCSGKARLVIWSLLVYFLTGERNI